MKRTSLGWTFGFCLAAACGGSGPAAGADAGVDAGLDAGSDAGVDAGRAVAPDGGRDAGGSDAGLDGGLETGMDAGVDAGRDAGSTADAGWVFAPTTTVAKLTQNNTSACGNDAGPCTEAWTQTHTVKYGSNSSYAGQTKTATGFWDQLVPAGPQDPGSSEGYLSKVPMAALLPGHPAPVWVETQNWWGANNGHIDNGEVSATPAQMTNQVADQVSRGVAGQVIDWYGPGTPADLALPTLQASAEATDGGYQFAVMIDQGYFLDCGQTTACLNSALAYLSSHYAGSKAYLKDAAGHFLVFFFVNDYYPASYGVLLDGGISYQNSRFVMYEPNGFPGHDPGNTVGEYGWVNPQDGAGDAQTTGSQGSFGGESDFGYDDLDGYLTNAKANQSATIVSEAFKGFDDNLASWSGDRIIDQRCGLTWLGAFSHNLSYLALGDAMDFVMVDTWDDYEEGTEIETGIDNCLANLAVTLSGPTLSWSPTFGEDPMDSAVSGSEATVYEYAIYLGQPGGEGLMPLSEILCTSASCPHTLDVSQLGIQGGPYVFYVRAVGMPSIVNTLSPPTAGTFTGG